MITLAQVRDWLKSFNIAENYYIGKLDNKKDKSIGVYSLKSSGTPPVALGGVERTTYEVKQISVLIHWNKNADETEQAAYRLFNELKGLTRFYIDSVLVYFIRLNVPAPQDVATDEKGVYERVIEFDIYYEKER